MVLCLSLSVLAFTTAFTALVAWYCLGLDRWRGYRLYAPGTWRRPQGLRVCG